MDPFRFGQIVSGKDFCPRPLLIEAVRESIRKGQNTYIQGERRTGKSSLIFEALRQLHRYRTVYVDLLEVKTTNTLMKRFIKAIISMEESREKFGAKLLKSFAHFRPSLSFDPVTGLPTLSLDASVKMEPDSLFGVMDLISSLHGKTKPIAVVFDEFQDILNLKDVRETLAILRARIQFHTDIPYIFAGSVRNKMDEIFIHPDSAFFKSAKLVSVGPLDSQDFIKFIESKFNSGKRSVDRQVLHTVFEICAHVAGDVQQLCSSLWEVTSSGHKINKEHIPLALKRIFAIESKVYESALLSITDQQLNCLTAVARYGGKAPTSSMFLQNSGIALASSVMKAIQRLVKLKILFRYGGEYRFSNPFFRAWLLFKNI